MAKLPVIKAPEFLKFLQANDFIIVRQKGSHIRLISSDGRATTVPIHGTKSIPKGLLRKIIRADLELSLEEFIDLYNEFKGN